MRRLVWALLLSFGLAIPAGAADFQEGVDYVRLPQIQPVETGNNVEVREVFWYGCPHCYDLEPALNKWLKTKPANAQFIRMPGIFRKTWEAHAKAFYAFEALGVTNKLHTPFFNALHGQNLPLNDEDAIAEFVAKQGLDKDSFKRAYNSFQVDARIRNAIQMGQRYGVEGVPTMIVDGKFRTDGVMTRSHERLMQVVDHLVKKAEAERKKLRK